MCDDQAKDVFKGCVFVRLPELSIKTQYESMRRRVKQYGAKFERCLTAKNYSTITHFLVDTNLLLAAYEVVESLPISRIGPRDQVLLALKSAKFVDARWMNDCIAKHTKLPTEKYEYKEVYSELEGYSETKRKSRKRRAENELVKKDKQKDKKPLWKTNKPDWIREILNGETLSIKNGKSNPNLPAIRALSKLRSLKELCDNEFKVTKYKTAINALLLELKVKITTAKQAGELPGIAAKGSIAQKIEEFWKTGEIQEIKSLEEDKDNMLLKYLKNIHGVGLKTAKDLRRMYQLKGVEDFHEKLNKGEIDLNPSQKLGLKYYDDWNTPIPRESTQLHENYVRKILASIDPGIEVTVTGSYRRGLKSSGDIDFLLTRRSWTKENLKLQPTIPRIIDSLQREGYVECILSHSKVKFYLGARLPSHETELKICRRVDLLFCAYPEIGAMLMYFTGNSIFNRMTRLLAQHEGMKLNNGGLFKVGEPGLGHIEENEPDLLEGKDVEDLESDKVEGEILESFDEKRIFSLLGIKWREPEERNIGEVDRI